MTQEEYLSQFRGYLEVMFQLTKAKNSDYAGPVDAFQNFTFVEKIGSGITTEQGIITRMTDKFQRLVNLLQRPAVVSDESIRDTLLDLAIYAVILNIYLEEKHESSTVGKKGKFHPTSKWGACVAALGRSRLGKYLRLLVSHARGKVGRGRSARM